LIHVGALVGWVDILITIAVIAVFYAVATRRGRSATTGERLFGANYLTQSSAQASRVGLRHLLQIVREQGAGSPSSDLDREVTLFRALGDRGRLRVVRLLLVEERTQSDVLETAGMSSLEVTSALRELEMAGIIGVRTVDGVCRYGIADDHVRAGLAELLTTWQDEAS
jgi:DNA-binding transcriptional ArsR family regulator